MGNFAAVRSALQGTPAAASGFGAWRVRSTREVSPRDRFDYCRAFPAASHIERALGTRDDFLAVFKYAATPDGIDFGDIAIDACVSRFGPGGDDAYVDIGMLNAGTMRIRHGRDQTLTLHAGLGPVLFDASRPMTTYTSRSDVGYLRLPRAAVVAAIGGSAVPRGMAVRPLAPGVLATELGACLRGVASGSIHDPAAVVAALRTARALALVALANLRGAGHHWPGELDEALFLAARHQLGQHLADPHWTVCTAANELGCSRAQLYRLFAARGQSVAEYLRQLRLQRAGRLLRVEPATAIGVVAARCGYAEPIAFDRAFRRRFGMTPTEWRARSAARARSPG